MIYAPSTQKCYTLGPERTGTAGASAVSLTGSYKVDSCSQCTNTLSDDRLFGPDNSFNLRDRDLVYAGNAGRDGSLG